MHHIAISIVQGANDDIRGYHNLFTCDGETKELSPIENMDAYIHELKQHDGIVPCDYNMSCSSSYKIVRHYIPHYIICKWLVHSCRICRSKSTVLYIISYCSVH